MSWKDYKPDNRPLSVIKAEAKKRKCRKPKSIHRVHKRNRFSVTSKVSYAKYLKTSHWKKVRREMLVRNNYRCQECGHGGFINIHHLSYKRLWEELGRDLAVLCRNCHRYEHFGFLD